MEISAKTDRSLAKVTFLRRVAGDLRRLGFESALTVRRTTLAFRCAVRAIPRTRMRVLHRNVRRSQLLASADFLRKTEERSILGLLTRGRDLDPHAVSPRVVVCQSRNEKAIYRYARLMQTVPSNNRVGRQMNFLVFDEGQSRLRLIGAIGLASPVYTIGCRDKYFGWSGGRSRKNRGLKRIMDVAVCIALAPYSYLLGGKLLASLAASDSVAHAFRLKYRSKLLALTTTCATGLHAPIFNRIMLVPGGLYRRIGETAGFTTSLYSLETIGEAKRLLESLGFGAIEQLHAWNALRVLRTALEACGVPADPCLRLGRPKGVYVASLSEQSLAAIRCGRSIHEPKYMSAGECLSYWRDVLLPKRLARQDILRTLRRFSPARLLLSRGRQKG